MLNTFENIEDHKKEVYFYLGLLSTLFAKMESKLLELLGLHITSNFVLANTLFERNSLAQNIEYLKKINALKDFEVKTVTELIQKISSVRKTRNLFIHGVWDEPIKFENEILVICRESKLDYKEEKENGKVITRQWASMKNNEFKLSFIKKLVENVQEILQLEDDLLEKIENHNYNNNL